MATAKNTPEQQELVPAESSQTLPADQTNADLFLQEQEQEQEAIESIPRLKIEQKKPDHLGKLYSEDVAQSWDDMNLVLLRATNSRILWPETFSSDNVPLCKSNDGVTPVPASDIPEDDRADYEAKAETCATCPLGQWTTVGKKRVPPTCTEIKDLLVIDTASKIPFFTSFSSLGLSACNKQLLKPLKLRVMALSAQRKSESKPPAHSCMFSFDISVMFDERDSGSSYQPVFSALQELPDEEKDLYVQVAIGCQQYESHGKPASNEETAGNSVSDKSVEEKKAF